MTDTQTAAMIASSSRVKTYINAILILCGMIALFVSGITFINPVSDNQVIIIPVLGIFTPLILALMAGAMKENHDAMNSRLTEFIKLTQKSSKAEGRLEK